MALHYLDTSALAKRYLREKELDWVDNICTSESITTSSLAEVEIASTLARQVREGTITAAVANLVFQRFRTDRQGYAVIGMVPAVLMDAAEILMIGRPDSRLRALDAIHLASARSSFAQARRRGLAEARFVTSDLHLAKAASTAGLIVVNPEEVS